MSAPSLPNSLPSETITPLNYGGPSIFEGLGKAVRKQLKESGKRIDKSRADAAKRREDALNQFKRIQTIGDKYKTPSSNIAEHHAAQDKIASQEAAMRVKDQLSSEPIKTREPARVTADPTARKGRRIEATAGEPSRQVQGTGQPIGNSTHPVASENKASSAKARHSIQFKDF